MNITNYLPVILRYAVVALMSVIAARGWISSEQNAILSQNTDIIVSALVALGTVAYALVKRPSNKAMQVAKEVDKKVPAADTVHIETPPGVPDIVVSADKKAG